MSCGTRKLLSPYLYLAPALILLGMLMLFPMIVVLRYSVLDNVIMNKNPGFAGFRNYRNVLTNPTFRISLVNTLYFTVMSVLFHLLAGLTFAMLLNSPLVNRTVKSILRVFYILPWVFTAAVIAILWRLLLSPAGVVNYILSTSIEWFSSSKTALHALTFVNIWAGYPFFMVSLLAGLQGIPGHLYEAAIIDGANEIRQFRHITLPHLTPIIISIAMLDFIWTMQVFPLVWMTTGGGPIHATEMLSTFTYKLAFSTYRFSQAAASAVIVLILSMSVAFVYIRHQKAREQVQ